MIELKNVSKTYEAKNKPALENISFQVAKGEILGVVGASGSGKSTLLQLLNLTEKPSSGEILFEQKESKNFSTKEIRSKKQKMAMIFQQFNLLHNLTVAENVALPLKLMGEKSSEKVLRYLDFVGLKEYATMYPRELSGGQKQRVAIARALVKDPQLLLCDEPTSALDEKSTQEIIALLKKIHEEFSPTIILVSHELSVVKALCPKALILEEGKLVETVLVKQTLGEETALSYPKQAKRRLAE